MKNTKKCVYNGSYTLEMALLFPLILSILMLLVYLTFFLYNRAVMEEAVYETACYGSTLDSSDKNYVRTQMQKKYEVILDHRLYAISDTQTVVTVNSSDVQISIYGEMKIPLFANLFEVFGKKTIIEADAVSEFINPKKIIDFVKNTNNLIGGK